MLSEMEILNIDSILFKEWYGVVFYSINGILGFIGEFVLVQDFSSKNVKEVEGVEGNYKYFSDDWQFVRVIIYILMMVGQVVFFSLRKLQN